MTICRIGLDCLMWRRSPSPMEQTKGSTYCSHPCYLFHPVSWQRPSIQHAKGAQVEVARVAGPEMEDSQRKEFLLIASLHEVCDAVGVLELGVFTIGEAIAVRL